MKYLFFVCFVTLISTGAIGQTRSVTNADLSGYTKQREKADREYRENYAKLGLPSPEELARRRSQSALDNREYADRIRAQDAEIERRAAEQRAAMRQFAPQVIVVTDDNGYADPGYFYSGGGYFPRVRRQYSQPGYYAGGQFWPTGPATPPRPIWVPNRRHR